MLGKNSKGELVQVPSNVTDMLERMGVKDWAQRRKIVKAACHIDLNPLSVPEQILNRGCIKQHARKNKTEEHTYVQVPGATLEDGSVTQGVFFRAELLESVFVELGRLISEREGK